jgi:hypothetical protein
VKGLGTKLGVLLKKGFPKEHKIVEGLLFPKLFDTLKFRDICLEVLGTTYLQRFYVL